MKITCRDFIVIPGEKHCMHYIKNKSGKGACRMDNRLMCEEFIRINHGEELAERFVPTEDEVSDE